MSQTVLDFYTDTAVLIGSYGPGEVLSPEDLAMIAATADDLFEEWNVDGLIVPSIRNDTYPLVALVGEYTLGDTVVTAGNLSTIRPLKIERPARIVINSILTLPVDVVDFHTWSAELEKGYTKVLPKMIYCDYAFPVANLHILPLPSVAMGAVSLELFTWRQLASFGADYTVTVALPPAYAKAFKYSLAVNIAPRLANSASNIQLVIEQAMGSKAVIQKLNADLRGTMLAPPPQQQQAA